MSIEDELTHVQALLDRRRRALRFLEQQIATYGGESNIPIKLFNDRADTQDEINRLQAKYAELRGTTSEESSSSLLSNKSN